MTTQLSPADLHTVKALLADYAPAQPALDILHQHQGNLEASLADLAMAAAGTAAYGDPVWGNDKTLGQVLRAAGCDLGCSRRGLGRTA